MSEILPEELWLVIEPLLPERPAKPKGGRPPADDFTALRGLLFILKTGLRWRDLPTEVFGCSGSTCRRRLLDWHEAGVWDKVHRILLEGLDYAGAIDWERALVDSASVAAKKGGR